MSRKKISADSKFGSRLRDARKKRGLTGSELAKTLEISQGSLSEIETGKTAPSFGTIENIIYKTDIDIIWLITGTAQPKQTPQPEATPTPTDIPNYFADLAKWAAETSGTGNLDWIQNLLDTCLPAFKTWREQKKSATERTTLHQDQVNRRAVNE